MQPHQKIDFINKFFHFTNPIPLQSNFTEEDLKSNDMKITLEIATRSNLRMQSDPKTGLVSFSCKNFGKNCYEIFAYKKQNLYFVQTYYSKVTHRRNCELRNQAFEYLKIYNLMKLKKNLIESVMQRLNLFNSSPSEILTKISNQEEYFFEKNINYNQEMRRKLRKRFDNIINIDIKKITKGGREELNDLSEVLKEQVKVQNQAKIEDSQSEFDETSFFEAKKKMPHKKKPKILKKGKEKSKKKSKAKSSVISRQNKENQYVTIVDSGMKKSLQRIQDEIYYNPASLCELKEIKELNQEFNGYEDIFAWTFNEQEEQMETQTINEKLKEHVFLSLRNSLIKRPLEGQSLEHLSFPQNFGFPNQDSQAYII